MKIVIRPRRGGKTHELLQYAISCKEKHILFYIPFNGIKQTTLELQKMLRKKGIHYWMLGYGKIKFLNKEVLITTTLNRFSMENKIIVDNAELMDNYYKLYLNHKDIIAFSVTSKSNKNNLWDV